uniref:Ig-like domain-containing protein n=1 Tax=Oryzias latipes TaxID=8090 RepID=A0A3P9IL63_ORYLA
MMKKSCSLPPSSLCSSPAGLEITKEPGEDVTLTCRTEENDKLVVLEWTRDNLGTKNVFVFRDGRPFPARQHESFRNRVFLKDNQIKDGDLSVVLKNVRIDDSGTYQCKVLHENDPQRELNLISIIHLTKGEGGCGLWLPGRTGHTEESCKRCLLPNTRITNCL